MIICTLLLTSAMPLIRAQASVEDFIREAESALAEGRLSDAGASHSTAGHELLKSRKYEQAAKQFEKAAELLKQDGHLAQSNSEYANAASSNQQAAAEKSANGKHKEAEELYEKAAENHEKSGLEAMAVGARRNAEFEKSHSVDEKTTIDPNEEREDEKYNHEKDELDQNCSYRKFAISGDVGILGYNPNHALFDQTTDLLHQDRKVLSMGDGTIFFLEGVTPLVTQPTHVTTTGISMLYRFHPDFSVRGHIQFGNLDVTATTTIPAINRIFCIETCSGNNDEI